jgi:hypothetical protein
MQMSLHKSSERAPCLELVAEHVSKLRFGVVQIVVHDSRVAQLERTEKVRIPQDAAKQADDR